MEPIDYRNATFADLKGRLSEVRLAVYQALLRHGPVTTEELAEKCGIALLTVRPRVTELVQLGYAELMKDDGVIQAARLRGYHKGGVYRALDEAAAYQIYLARVREANRETQGALF